VRLAIEKRAREVEAQRAQEKAKLNAIRNSIGTSGFAPNNHSSHVDSIPSGPRATGVDNGGSREASPFTASHRDNPEFSGPQSHQDSPDSLPGSKRGSDETAIDDSELGSMRARYMGIAPTKPKKRRLTDRKFVFDWSTDADTSNSNAESSNTVSIAFGRGHFGGLDSGGKLRHSLDRHWTEKELIEMTERDWRIFREDFSISTKGSCLTLTPNILTLIKEVAFPRHFGIGRRQICLHPCCK
jgi:ATP-dependent RNA helicase DDX23/PRP28